MFENLLEICQNGTNLNNIKNSSVFYFKKGQDALNQWLKMELSDEQESSIISLSTDYNEFAKISVTNTQLFPIQQLLYLITSYCDEKAKDKNIFNEYDDKRILARAGVRMGSWIKSLVEYKFNKQSVIGSTKNAFDYLLDPSNNSTILSENHREFIITHYLNKNYQPELFVSDLKTIFHEYNLTVENENNYTHYISSLIYSYVDDWRPKKSVFFKQLIEQLTTHFADNNINFKILKLGQRAKFVWLGDKDFIIGNEIAHYEVSNRGIKGNKKEIFVDVHFEAKNKIDREIFYNTIQKLPENLEWIDWYKSKSIGYKESFNLDNYETILENITSALEYIDNSIGDSLRKIISSISGVNEINVKEEFIDWMIANVSEGNYFKNQFASNRERFEKEINDYEIIYKENFNSELFIINANEYKNEIELRRTNIYSKSTTFSKYNEKHYSGRPSAILGNNNYLRFLNEYFTNKNKMENNSNNNQFPLNQILYGPPGTGKTFNTINEALKIVDPIYYLENKKDRKKLTDRFKELLIKNSDENKGQIAFCTFHQSFSYEDFVEGIKPKTNEIKGVYYDTEPGVFKRICQLADSYNSTVKVKKEGILSWSDEQFRKASFYKLSLGAFYNPSDKPIYEYCRDNSYIAIGFGQENDFTGLSESEIVEKCDELDLEVTAAQQMNYFIHYLKKGNYVIIGNGNKYVRALGKVVGDYEYVAESPIMYNHFRKVEWIFVDENIPIEEIYERGLSQKTMYKIDETALKQDFFTNDGQETLIEVKDEEKKYVLIIDEINRGNVSSIFGELITLIEKDKRAGCDEELEVTLPYSKEPFKVPNNVYLIGTMNTADRSIEALDTALRRRFSFKEFPPKTDLIKTEGASGKVIGIVDDIDLEALLITINNRIEKLIDKDHRIGHSYFLKVDSKQKLIYAFKNEIIPLLEEYFFGDYGKIGLVLGNSFVEKINHDFSFADFKAYDTDIQSDLKEKAVFRITDDSLWNFSTI